MIGSRGTVAYWIGNFVATLPARPGIPAGKARVRGTFVFERRHMAKAEPGRPAPRSGGQICVRKPGECRWVLVQGHVSQPVDDGPDPSGERHDLVTLTTAVFGTSLVSSAPLEVTCDDGSPRTPAKALKPAAPGKPATPSPPAPAAPGKPAAPSPPRSPWRRR